MSARCHSVSTNFSSDQRNALTGISRLRPFSLIKWQTPDSSCQSDVSLMSDVSDPGAVRCHQPGARHPVCHESSVSMSPSHHVICHLCDGVSDLLRVIRAHTTQLHQTVMSAVRSQDKLQVTSFCHQSALLSVINVTKMQVFMTMTSFRLSPYHQLVRAYVL